ncbi:DUF4252 domain-containing protein [Hanstruepera ponticola]|uniref:DUF4252 domain-containing protein n=1 Tax=Hanstruepera ponticola TaxID=2042995 RepID=UPI001784880D|nr:DUF4252 domain-containing protein [Hanstruepera ponticola]
MKTINNLKINTFKKYTVTLLMVILLLPLTSMAQDIFAKYDGNIDVTYVDIKPKMFQILAKMDVKIDDPDMQDYLETVNSITSLKALVTGEASISNDIATWVDSKSKNLEELIEIRDEGTVVKFYIKEGREQDHVEELLIFINGISNQMNDSKTDKNGKALNIETVVVSVTGNIDLKQINFDLIGDQIQSKQSSAKILSQDSMVFKDLKVYPNPSQDKVTIDLPSELKNNVNITVLNAQGKQVKTQVINAQNKTLDISDLQAGVYLIQFIYDDSRVVKRFVKQ